MDGWANEVMDEAGAFARRELLAEDLGHFKLAQACIRNILIFLFFCSSGSIPHSSGMNSFEDIQIEL